MENTNKIEGTNHELLSLLSQKIDMPVVALVYGEDEEIEKNDVSIIVDAISGIESDKACLIIHGNGGHFDSAIELGVFLRQKFHKKLVSVIPKKAASAKAYIVLLSNEAWFSEKGHLTQFDIIFNYKGNLYRAHEELDNPEREIRDDAKFIWNISAELLTKIFLRQDSLCNEENVTRSFVLKVMDICMRNKSSHDIAVRPEQLKKLNFNVKTLDQEIEKEFCKVVENSLENLKKQGRRFSLESEKLALYIF